MPSLGFVVLTYTKEREGLIASTGLADKKKGPIDFSTGPIGEGGLAKYYWASRRISEAMRAKALPRSAEEGA